MKQLIGRALNRFRFAGKYPAGHYSSPIPSRDDVLKYLKSRPQSHTQLLDINLNTEYQFSMLQEYCEYYADLPFPEQKAPDCRYYYAQKWFCYADAIFLYSFLRRNRPKRIIEVGSGLSSAVMLDTRDRFLDQDTDITFIEPYPDRLLSILRPEDKEKIRIIDQRVQDTSIESFGRLQSGDLLFIDSSHVVKFGSDLQFLLFDVIPALPRGIFVHFHDIFFPFEYPSNWLTGGRYLNEDYFLRAFLAYNSQWSIFFFNDYVGSTFRDFLAQKMPLCLKNTGGSLYIRKADGD